MQEYGTARIKYKTEVAANKAMQIAREFLNDYSYEEPDKCNWAKGLSVENSSVKVDSGAMCGWLDFENLFRKLCEKLSDECPDQYFEGESEYENISSGYSLYMCAKYGENGLEIKESTIRCEYCGNIIFSDDIIFMRNVDEGSVVAFCSEGCREIFLVDEGGDEEWEEATYEDYEEENEY